MLGTVKWTALPLLANQRRNIDKRIVRALYNRELAVPCFDLLVFDERIGQRIGELLVCLRLCFCLNTMCGTPTQATGLEMDAISSAVIGGTLLTGGVGNVIGTLFGVLINGTISSLVKFNGKLVASWANIITAVLLCFFILLQAIFAKIKERQK